MITRTDFVNIIYLPQVWEKKTGEKVEGSDSKTFSKLRPLTFVRKHSVILIFGYDNILPLLETLDLKTKIIFWIHANLIPSGNNNHEIGNIYFYDKIKFGEELPNLEISFITADSLTGKDIGESDCDKDFYRKLKYERYDIKLYPLNAIRGLDYLIKKKLPPIQTIGEILTKTKEGQSFYFSDNSLDRQVFEHNVSKDTTKIILKEIIGGDKILEDDPEVTVLTPGFSGAYVILVRYKEQNIRRSAFIVKIDKNRERLERETVRKKIIQHQVEIDQDTLIFATESETKIVNDCFYLTYRAILDLEPLSKKVETLVNIYKNPTTEEDSLLINSEIIQQYLDEVITAFEPFTRISDPQKNMKREIGFWQPNCEKDESKNGHKINCRYKGLSFNDWTQDKSLKALENIIKLTKDKDLQDERDFLISFIREGKFYAIPIDRKNTYVPTAIVHGDFHTDNIFVGDVGTKPRFIDFALTSSEPNNHAFTDIGKLSVDIEMKIITDDNFFMNHESKNFFESWCYVHKEWVSQLLTMEGSLQEEKIKKCSPFGQILLAYEINDSFIDFVKKYHKKELKTGRMNNTIPLSSFIIQFLMVRVHFLIKMTTYSDILLEKRYFAFRACLDILKLVTKHEKPATL